MSRLLSHLEFRVLRDLVRAITLATALLLCMGAEAQSPAPKTSTSPGEFAAQHERLRKTTNIDEMIVLAETLLKLESTLKEWPLAISREALRGELWWLLGGSYQRRQQGSRADNLETAIKAYETALTFRTRQVFPVEWAITQNSLGIAYRLRIRGARADNLELAIKSYEAALAVRTRQALPQPWAETHNNLGIAYRERIQGNRADNLELALKSYEAALTVRTRETMPRDWAVTQNNLGNAHRERIRGNRADNLEAAIKAFEAALTVRTREAMPRDWAETHNNLANVYLDRIRGNRGENLEAAIKGYDAALTVRTREAMPREWAEAQHNLAAAYRLRIQGDRTANLQTAVKALEASLTVLTRDALPRQHLRTGRQLGEVLLDQGDWRAAGAALASARDAFLMLFGEGLQETEARDLIAEAGPLFAQAAFAAIERGEVETAWSLMSEGKARLLAVALRQQTLDLSPDKRRRLDALRTSIREISRTYETAAGQERASLLDKLFAQRQELLTLVQAAGAKGGKETGGDVLATSAVPAGGVIVAPVITSRGAKLLVLAASTKGKPLTIVDLPGLTTAQVDKLMRGDGTVGASGGWLGAFNVQYLPSDQLNARIGEWTGAVENIGREIWRLFAARLDAALQERGVKQGSRVVWVPTGSLGLLPLALAHDPASTKRFGEKYEVVSVPSLEALTQAARQVAQAQAPSLAVIINPTGDLPFTEVESTLVAGHFKTRPSISLDKSNATPRAVLAGLKNKSYWHFSSHGRFDWEDARRAGLIVKDGETLTIGAFLDAEGSLGRPRLVVLSACETGLYDTARNADEFVGLPATFMQLGAVGVLGTLWQVDDLATSLLMAKFYDLHLTERLAPPTALNRAQSWLRTSTRDDLLAYARSAATAARLDGSKLTDLLSELTNRRRVAARLVAVSQRLQRDDAAATQNTPAPAAPDMGKRPPFAHPYYWGGFVYTGL